MTLKLGVDEEQQADGFSEDTLRLVDHCGEGAESAEEMDANALDPHIAEWQRRTECAECGVHSLSRLCDRCYVENKL